MEQGLRTVADPIRRRPRLTHRHVRLLQLLADDRTLRQAARELGVSESYVYNAMQAIKAELEVDTVTGAVAYAMREKLLA